VFTEQWTGRGGPPAWPACPAGINLLDIYPWGHSKSTVNATDVSSVQGLQQRTQNGSEMMRTTLGIFLLFRQSMFGCATCVEAQGEHFGGFL